MARTIITQFDRLINIVILLLLVGGGMLLHTLTALTLKSYYGDPWGYVCFALPGISEAYLIIVQLADDMYNYTVLFAGFVILALTVTATWYVKNIVRQRLENLLQSRS